MVCVVMSGQTAIRSMYSCPSGSAGTSTNSPVSGSKLDWPPDEHPAFELATPAAGRITSSPFSIPTVELAANECPQLAHAGVVSNVSLIDGIPHGGASGRASGGGGSDTS